MGSVQPPGEDIGVSIPSAVKTVEPDHLVSSLSQQYDR